MNKINAKIYATCTGPKHHVYYVDQIPEKCEKCDLFINRSGNLVDIRTQEQFPVIPQNKDGLKILLVGGYVSGVEKFEQAFTIQQIETLRYISSMGYHFEICIKGIDPDVSYLF